MAWILSNNIILKGYFNDSITTSDNVTHITMIENYCYCELFKRLYKREDHIKLY